MGNRGSFVDGHVPVKVNVVRLKCPFQDGVYVNSFCDGEKCPYGLWCVEHKVCGLRCHLDGNGGLNRAVG